MASKKPRPKLSGHNIKQILTEIKMSQSELADLAMDGDNSRLSKIINEKAGSAISLPVAHKIAQALGKSIEEVFNF